jgi:hypothetical protein
MRIQVGSRVKFLNDVGGGILKSFVGEKMALIETDDGFEVTVLVTELLPDTGAYYGMDGEEPVTAEPIETNIKQAEEPVVTFEQKKYLPFNGEAFLAIVPRNEQVLHVSNFGLYLVNTSNYKLMFIVSIHEGKISTLIKPGTIEPDTKLEIEEYSQTSIAKVKEFRLQGIFFKEGLGDAVAPVDQTFSIENVSFYKIAHFSDNAYFQEKALLLRNNQSVELKEAVERLKSNELDRVVQLKENKEPKKEHRSPKSTTIEEVDLHIEEILENTSDLSNGEILENQMARFETALETAIRSDVQKIVFIHGVGNGRLRQELRKKLDRKYPDLKYQDASFKEYGYGATMVYLK